MLVCQRVNTRPPDQRRRAKQVSNLPRCKLGSGGPLVWHDLTSMILDTDLFETRQRLHWDLKHNGFVSKCSTPDIKHLGKFNAFVKGVGGWTGNFEAKIGRSLRSSGAAGCCSPFGSRRKHYPFQKWFSCRFTPANMVLLTLGLSLSQEQIQDISRL